MNSKDSIEHFLRQSCAIPGITDILINGPNDLWIDTGKGLHKIADFNSIISSAKSVYDLAFHLALLCNERLDEQKPICDGLLAGGQRFHAVISPLVSSGAVISIRIPNVQQFEFDDMVTTDSIHHRLRNHIADLIEDKQTILIAGSTGSGKTTLLKALLNLIPKDERIIAIEEFREIEGVDHPHFVSLSSKQQNSEGFGEIGLDELVKCSLRMRPDRIVLGEVRGKEIRELMNAFNTGHNGGFSTIHANSLDSVPQRIQSLALLAELDLKDNPLQIASAFNYIFFMKRVGNARFLQQIGKLEVRDSQIAIKPIYSAGPTGSHYFFDPE